MSRFAMSFIFTILMLSFVTPSDGSIWILDSVEIAIGMVNEDSLSEFSMLDNFTTSRYHSILATNPYNNIVYRAADELYFPMVNNTLGQLNVTNKYLTLTSLPLNNILNQYQNSFQHFMGSWRKKPLFIDLPDYVGVFDSGILSLSSIDILKNQSSTTEYNLTQILRKDANFPVDRHPSSDDGIIRQYSMDFEAFGVYNDTVLVVCEVVATVLGIDSYSYSDRLFFVYIDLNTGSTEVFSELYPSDFKFEYYNIILGKELNSILYKLSYNSNIAQSDGAEWFYHEISANTSFQTQIPSLYDIDYYELTNGSFIYKVKTESQIIYHDLKTGEKNQFIFDFGFPVEKYPRGKFFMIDEYLVFIGYDYYYTDYYEEGPSNQTSPLALTVYWMSVPIILTFARYRNKRIHVKNLLISKF